MKIIVVMVIACLCLTFVLATAPTHTQPLLISDTEHKNSYQDNLTLYNQSTYDADGDEVKNIYTFYVNGTTRAELIMPFEGDSTAVATYDHSGNNNDATVTGAVWNETIGYDNFGAYAFNGTDHYITIGTGGEFSLQNAFTLTAWIKTNKTTGNQSILSDYDGTGTQDGIQLFIENDDIVTTLSDSADINYIGRQTTGNEISTDTWYHVAVTWDGTFSSSGFNIYIDGQVTDDANREAGTVNSFDVSPDPMRIGVTENSSGLSSYFNGTIDDVYIYDRVLSATEINDSYRNITNRIINTSLTTNDLWRGCITPTDNNGSTGTMLCSDLMYINGETNFFCFYNQSTNCNGTYLKILGVENDTGGYMNAHGQNYSLQTYANSLCCTAEGAGTVEFNCSTNPLFNLTDEDNAHAEIDTFDTVGYNETICLSKTPHNLTCSFKGLCTITETCLLTLSNQEAGTNAHISNCLDDTWLRLCCRETNTPPTNVTLKFPANSTSTPNRTINFTWTSASDADGDSLTYQLNLTFSSPVACGANQLLDVGAVLKYEVEDLCTDEIINWSVRAYDGLDYGAWSDSWNLTIFSVVSINLTTDIIDFGSMNNLEVDDTTDDNPNPLVVENDGNVVADISLRADQGLWNQAALNTSYWQTRVDNTTEDDSFAWVTSQTTWMNISSPFQNIIDALQNDVNDTAQIEIRVEVPFDELAGDKEGILRVYGVAD